MDRAQIISGLIRRNEEAYSRTKENLEELLELMREATRKRDQRIADLTRRLKVFQKHYRQKDCESIAAQIQRTEAIDCLLRILEGRDTDKAIVEAGIWLKSFFNDDELEYKVRADMACKLPGMLAAMQEAEEFEWPTEIRIE